MAAAAGSGDWAAVSHEAAHEYVHLVLRASNLQVPPWLKEGLAELYSTLRNGRSRHRTRRPVAGASADSAQAGLDASRGIDGYVRRVAATRRNAA